jgi:hypothetical protein
MKYYVMTVYDGTSVRFQGPFETVDERDELYRKLFQKEYEQGDGENDVFRVLIDANGGLREG